MENRSWESLSEQERCVLDDGPLTEELFADRR